MRQFAFRLVCGVALRVAVEALLIRQRRREASNDGPDPAFGLLALGSMVVVAVYAVVLAVWLLTGWGPGGRWLVPEYGARRRRP
jgi:hypothetical protein